MLNTFPHIIFLQSFFIIYKFFLNLQFAAHCSWLFSSNDDSTKHKKSACLDSQTLLVSVAPLPPLWRSGIVNLHLTLCYVYTELRLIDGQAGPPLNRGLIICEP